MDEESDVEVETASMFPYGNNSDDRDQLRIRVNDRFELDMFSDGQINFGVYGTAGAINGNGQTFVQNPWITVYNDSIPDLIVALTYFLEHHVRHNV